jgi:hypothetical protein
LTEAHNHLGHALKEAHRLDEAIAACRRAIQLKPDYAEAYNNLGAALGELGRIDEAMAACNRALQLQPDYAEAHSNLGIAHADKGQFDEAIAAYNRAMQLQPDFVGVHWNISLVWLLLGDFQQGWPEFEWRWKSKWLRLQRAFTQPRWDGSPLGGKTILLHSEQGLGDTIQFARYAPLVAQRGGHVILSSPPALARLLESLTGLGQIIAEGNALPRFDVHCPLLSLPLVMGTDCLAAIPGDVPYLRPPTDGQAAWKKRLSADDANLKIGLAWAGRPHPLGRSIPLAALAPLASIPGVSFHSLQTGPAAQQAHEPPAKMKLIDYSSDLHDLADTASLIANLDLVITIDTAVAHLAGAMGKPVWTMLKFVPDWRWLLNRSDSPWYPTMRLFRQQRLGNWTDVIAAVAERLRVESDLQS